MRKRACPRSSRSARRPGGDADVSVYTTPLTPLGFLGRSAEISPAKTAIVDGERRVSYREFAREATRLARALQAVGVERGDRVAYLCPNTAELLVAHFAVPLAGAVLVPVNTRPPPHPAPSILEDSDAELVA